MRSWFIIIIILFGSCRSTRLVLTPELNSGKLSIDFESSEDKFNLRGIAYFSPDSNYLNIFGPLGINLLKLKTIGDQIKIVDIQNKKIYNSVYRNVSGLMNNIFSGKFEKSEEQLVCALYMLIKNEVLCSDFSGNRKMRYSFKEKAQKNDFSLNIENGASKYKIKVVFFKDTKVSNSSEGWMKYDNFETIFVRLQ